MNHLSADDHAFLVHSIVSEAALLARIERTVPPHLRRPRPAPPRAGEKTDFFGSPYRRPFQPRPRAALLHAMSRPNVLLPFLPSIT